MNSRQRTVALLPFLMAVLAFSAQAKSFEHWQPETLLSWTVASGNAEAVAKRIRTGADVNEVDSAGRTALMWSSICKSSSVARVLIQAGARVDPMDRNGYTALAHSVIRPGLYAPPCETNDKVDVDLVRLLIDAGSDVNARPDPEGMTPLHHALRYLFGGGWQSPAVVKALLDAGADPNATSFGGWAPLNQVAYNARPTYGSPAPSHTLTTLFEMLVAAGADPNQTDWAPPQ